MHVTVFSQSFTTVIKTPEIEATIHPQTFEDALRVLRGGAKHFRSRFFMIDEDDERGPQSIIWPRELESKKISINIAKLFHFFGTEIESISKMKYYLKSTIVKVTFSKDIQGLNVFAQASCEPFKNTHFDMQMESQVSAGSRLCQVADMPMFCNYTKFKGKDFVLSAKAGLVRDERIIDVGKGDGYVNIA